MNFLTKLLSDVVTLLLRFVNYTGVLQSESARAFCATCRRHRTVARPILDCFKTTNPCATIDWSRLYPG